MKNFLDFIKLHKNAILVSTMSFVILGISTITTILIINYNKKNQRNIATSATPESFGKSVVTSDDVLTVVVISKNQTQKETEQDTKNELKENEEKEPEQEKNEDEIEEKEEEFTQETDTNNSLYYIKINKAANTVTIYTKDSNRKLYCSC